MESLGPALNMEEPAFSAILKKAASMLGYADVEHVLQDLTEKFGNGKMAYAAETQALISNAFVASKCIFRCNLYFVASICRHCSLAYFYLG